MLSITKRFKFESAHHLPFHEGKCKGVHGHSYILEIEVTGILADDESGIHGMIMDFSDLKKIVHEYIVEVLDHQDLNLHFDNPTAEAMVLWIRNTLLFRIESGPTSRLKLVRVRLWETEDSYAEWKLSDR